MKVKTIIYWYISMESTPYYKRKFFCLETEDGSVVYREHREREKRSCFFKNCDCHRVEFDLVDSDGPQKRIPSLLSLAKTEAKRLLKRAMNRREFTDAIMAARREDPGVVSLICEFHNAVLKEETPDNSIIHWEYYKARLPQDFVWKVQELVTRQAPRHLAKYYRVRSNWSIYRDI
jgi:hypothetical protein